MRGPGNQSLQRGVRAKHVNADVDAAVMRKCLDDQIVGRIDIFADLQDHRQRSGRLQIGGEDFGQTIVDRSGYAACILVPIRKLARI